jgi:dienelactone hydrolase
MGGTEALLDGSRAVTGSRRRPGVRGVALRSALVGLAVAGCAPFTPRADLRDGATGTIAFATQSPTGPEFLRGTTASPPATISGELTLPTGATGRVPAVVLIHGSSGVGSNMAVWRSELTGAGMATLIVDSFTGRGVRETATDQSRVSTAAMVVDAYRALALLATHPAIDPGRIAVMGFSKGGIVAASASLERFYELWGAPGLRFRAHVPFYPSCGIQLLEETRVSAPIRIFHGVADDWTPIAPCHDYVDRMRRGGADARMVELPGALHAFDVPSLPSSLYLPAVQNGSACRVVERTPGAFFHADTGRPAVSNDPCVGRGATVGYDARAQRAAIDGVKAFLRDTFAPGAR